jgi:regulator of extracellular matrix RemA (YlzA/DUF370 family)
MKLLNIGFNSMVSSDRIVALLAYDSAPVKRIISVAKDRGMAVDATFGRRTRSVIMMDTGHVILSGISTDTISSRSAAQKDEPQ